LRIRNSSPKFGARAGLQSSKAIASSRW